MTKFAIDFGTSVTKIFRLGSGNGVVLAEATCVTVDKTTREIKAYGDDAKKVLGKTADTEVVFPVYEGEIVDEALAGKLLSHFMEKTGKKRGAEVLFCVPLGCNAQNREKYLRVARIAGLSRVDFAEVPYLAALGMSAPVSESRLLHRHRRGEDVARGLLLRRHHRGADDAPRRKQHGCAHHRPHRPTL